MKIQHTQTYPDVQSFIIAHLELINCVLPIKTTPSERTMLAAFMTKPGERFSPKNKKAVKEELNLKNNQMSTTLGSLLTKGFVREKEEDGLLEVHPMVLIEGNTQEYSFRYEVQAEETEENR